VSDTSIQLLLLAASLVPPGPPRAASPGAAVGRVPLGAWVCPGHSQQPDDVVASLAKRGVLLLGETHDQAEHHLWQLDMVASLLPHRPDMVLGFEMFPRRVQPVLDRWSNGELDEAAFLRESDWTNVWGFDAGLYLPLFHFVRIHHLPMLALNVDRATSRRVAAQGLAAVARDEREGVGDPAPASPSYRARLFQWFKQHPAGGGAADVASARFDRFVGAQLLWDRAMAEAIAGARRQEHPPLVIGMIGSGHVAYGEGVVHQLAALGGDDVMTALPWPAETDFPADQPRIADLLFGVAPA
jgi:uncharacterized iron-regulated protein